MKLYKLKNKKIALLGLGVENFALAKYLIKNKIECEITICDFRGEKLLVDKFEELQAHKSKFLSIDKQITVINKRLGHEFNQGLDEFDILFRSPGWPIMCPGIQAALKVKKNKNDDFLYSPMRLFIDLCPTKKMIGVTGTKGKGTTSSLIYQIVKSSGKKVFLGGNIGIAPFDFLEKIKKEDFVVLELSSFQLEDMRKSPWVSVLTNFSKEHLAAADPNNPNYHISMQKYWSAKANIFMHQTENDYLVINTNLESKIKKNKTKARIVFFDKSGLSSRLPGEHNKENIAAAEQVARIMKIKKNIIEKAVYNFRGLEHRLEFFYKFKGVEYYNDTFATTPESAITALRSFKNPIVLIAGGADKGSDFKKFVQEIKKKTKYIILLSGNGSDKIIKEASKINLRKDKLFLANSIKEAVLRAVEVAVGGDIVLLSPACASFGMFKNYKERGIQFKEEVNKIK